MAHKFDDIVFGRADPDNGIKLNDIVQTPNIGYHIVEKIEKRVYDNPSRYQPSWPCPAPYPSKIYYRKIAEPDGTPTLNSVRRGSCASVDATVLTNALIKQKKMESIKKAQYKGDNLEHLVGIRHTLTLCDKHPHYTAKRKPRADCPKCLEIWNRKKGN